MNAKCLKFKPLMIATLAAICSLFMNSCSDEPEEHLFDFNPVFTEFQIVDDNGIDLIATGGSLYQANFNIQYDSEIYSAQWSNPMIVNWNETSQSRYYMPKMYGLFYLAETDKGNARLVFGELDGNLGEADIVLNMPDGSNHTIHISRHITTKGPNAYVKQTVTLDGEKIDSMTDGNPFMDFKIIARQ